MQTNSSVTQLLVVRHGQSTWNVEGRWQGQADPPLSDFGRQQAFAASQAVGQVDAIVSSPQIRAAQTATIISEQIGVGPVQLVDGLQERNAGEWSGLTREDIDARWPGWVVEGRRPDSYEDTGPFVERIFSALNQVVTTFEGGTVLVVCHGGVIIEMERELGVNESRIPNLHGRVVTAREGGLVGGERLALLPDELRTGGTGVVESRPGDGDGSGRSQAGANPEDGADQQPL
jgi:probable phosphoglycerate mutase